MFNRDKITYFPKKVTIKPDDAKMTSVVPKVIIQKTITSTNVTTPLLQKELVRPIVQKPKQQSGMNKPIICTFNCADCFPTDIITILPKLRIFYKNPNIKTSGDIQSIIESQSGFCYEDVINHLRYKFGKMYIEYRRRRAVKDSIVSDKDQQCNDVGVCVDPINNINIKNLKLTTLGPHAILRLEYI